MNSINDAKSVFLEFCERISTGIETYAKTAKLSIERQKCKNKIRAINERLGAELIRSLRSKTELNEVISELSLQESKKKKKRINEIDEQISKIRQEEV